VTKAALRNLITELARKRREVRRLQKDVGDLHDHLTLIEARARYEKENRYSTAEVKRALGIGVAANLPRERGQAVEQ
jgi:hypothetical protein